VGASELLVGGAAVYSANVPAGDSTLSMAFDGASWYQGSIVGNAAGIDALYASLNFNEFSLSCDVQVKAVGTGGFSFPVSIGRTGSGGGGLAIIEQGGTWNLLHHLVNRADSRVPVTLNRWTHIDLVRKPFGPTIQSVLYLDGTPVVTNTTTPIVPTDWFTIGASEKGSQIPGDVEGPFQGLVDNVVITNLALGAPPSLVTIARTPATIYTGNSIILTAGALTGDPAGRALIWRRDGAAFTNSGTATRIAIPNVTTNNAGNYDVVLSNNYGAVTSALVAVTVLDPSYSGGAAVLRYRLGDNDPGAVAGNFGNAVTKDALGTNDLTAFGTPFYTADVPAGGGALSMGFDGGSFYRKDDLADAFARVDLNNFSLSLDVKITALGGAGYSFPITIGSQTAGSGGFAVVEIGGLWRIIHQMVGTSSAATGVPVALDQWTRLELPRRQFGTAARSRLFINGVDSGMELTTGPTPANVKPILTIGGNTLADLVNIEGGFVGLIDNVVLHNYSAGAKPELTTGIAASPSTTLVSGESLLLTATASGAAPLTYNWRKDGAVFASTTGASGTPASTTLASVTAADSGSYSVVVTNLTGAVTSSVVTVTVLPPGATVPRPNVAHRLGEDDPGSVAGNPGNAVSKDTTGTYDLTANGNPLYSANVPTGGSTLAMAFDGASYYEGTGTPWTDFYSTFDWNNFVLAYDVNITAPGASGFSFPVSLGGMVTGFAIFEEAGKWRVLHHGVGYSPVGPEVTYDKWTRLELRRVGGQSRLVIDGVDTGIANTGNFRAPAGRLTVGNNIHTSGPEGYFTGLVDNIRLFSYSLPASTLSLQWVGGQATVTSQGRANAHYTLWRSPALSPATWTMVTEGVADSTGRVTLTDPTPSAAGAFYRTSAP